MIKSIIFFFSLLATIPSVNIILENDIQKKIIRNKEFDIECYVLIDDKTSFDKDKIYHWFKTGEIHSSQSSSGGKLLHDRYIKYYRSNQLAEKGLFHYGLKDGLWKVWYENGQLKELIEWDRGEKSGSFVSYDSIGNVLNKGDYKNGFKTGKWINVKKKDTIIYKNGLISIPDAKTEDKGFFKRFFKKREKSKVNNVKSNTTKKEGFFKRPFSKKTKNKKQ